MQTLESGKEIELFSVTEVFGGMLSGESCNFELFVVLQ